MKKTKILASVFVVIAAVLILSLSAFAATEYTYGKYKYTLTENDTVCITKYTGTSKTVTIPSEINGKVVTHIGKKVFGEDCPTQKVIIPDSVTTIQNGFDFSNIKTVEIGSGVTEIETDAFYGAWKLEKIIVSDKNTAYKSVDGILYDKEMKTLIRVPYNKKCTKLVISEGVKTIGSNATRNVELESIVIPSTVKKIESYGLSFTGAKSLVIPASVETLEFNAIYHCYGVEKIEIKKGKLKSLDLDDISYCYDLRTVIIPENVEFIDRFRSCTALEEIVVDAKNKNYTTIDGVLYNKEKTKILIYPASKADETYIIPSSVTVIGDDAFNDIHYKSLKKIYMHVGVKKIEEWAFIYSGGIAISYEGTKAQFDAIKKEDSFHMMVVDITYNNYIYRPVENINVTAKDTSVTLNWDKVPGATGYRVYLKSGSSWKALKTTTARKYTAEGLSSGTTYTFAIKSYSKASGKTVWAPEQSTVKATTQLGVTTSLKSTTANNSVTLKWTAVNGATGYRVYVKNKETGKWDIAVRTTGKKTTTTIKDLEPGTKYTFAVRAYLNNGSIVWAPKYKSINTVTKPGVTDKVTSTSTENSVTLKWNKVPGATGYRIYVERNGKWKALKTTTGLTYTATGLTAGTKYTFAVKAYKKYAGVNYWASNYKKLGTATLPGATKSLTASKISSEYVTLKWDSVRGATGYRVYVWNTQTKNWDIVYKATTKLTVTLKNLVPGKNYIFAVKAYTKTDSGYIWAKDRTQLKIKTGSLTDDYVRELLIETSEVYLKWSTLFTVSSEYADEVEGEHLIYDESDSIKVNTVYGERNYYAVVDEVKTIKEIKEILSKYFAQDTIESVITSPSSGYFPYYVERNGKLYVAVFDGWGYEGAAYYTDSIKKISSTHYKYFLKGYDFEGERYFDVVYHLVYENGKWVFTERYEDENEDSAYGFYPIIYPECIRD